MKRFLALGFGCLLGTLNALPQSPPSQTTPASTEQPPPVAPPLTTTAAPEVAPLARGPGGSGFRVRRQHRGLVGLFHDVELERQVCVPEVITVLGDARIDGEVLHDVTVVLGDARVSGRVRGNLAVILGDLELTDTARVNGEVTLVGGELKKAPGAVIEGIPLEVPLAPAGARLRQWFRSGLFMARPLPPKVRWAWSLVGLHFLFYLLLSLLLPRPVADSVRELKSRPVPCFLVGVLSLVLCVPLALILSATGVGLLLVPLLLLLLTGAVFLGKTATLQFIGFRLAERVRPAAQPGSLWALGLGSGLIALLYMVPVLGLVAWGVLLPLGLGAVLLGLARNFPSQGASVGAPRPVPPLAASGAGGPSAATPAARSASPLTDAPPGDVPPPPAANASGPLAATVESFSAAELACMPRAGFWLRLAATVLDFILLIWVLPVAKQWFVPLWVAYHVALWTWKGTTIGGIVCGLKIIRPDGRPVDFTVALVRSLASVFSFAALGLGFFWAGWTRDHQAWHDRIAGTAIVKLPKGVSLI